MGLHLPAELHWLEWVVGSEWPTSDETVMRAGAPIWHAAADALDQLGRDVLGSGNAVGTAVQGLASDAFAAYGAGLATVDRQFFMSVAAHFRAVGGLLIDGAREIGYAKLMFRALLVTLAVEIAFLLAALAWSAGTSAQAIARRQMLARRKAQLIGRRLRTSIAAGAAYGGSINAGLDVLVQWIQIKQGNRSGFDLTRTGMSALGGAAGGAAGGAIAHGLSKGTWLVPDAGDSTLRTASQLAARSTAIGGVSGAGAAVAGTVATGGPLSLGDVLREASSGGTEAGTHGAKHGVQHGLMADLHGLGGPLEQSASAVPLKSTAETVAVEPGAAESAHIADVGALRPPDAMPAERVSPTQTTDQSRPAHGPVSEDDSAPWKTAEIFPVTRDEGASENLIARALSGDIPAPGLGISDPRGTSPQAAPDPTSLAFSPTTEAVAPTAQPVVDAGASTDVAARQPVVPNLDGQSGSNIAATAAQNAIPEITPPLPRITGYTKVGPQVGTNPGGFYRDAEGVEWYVKAPPSDLHARNEALGMDLYREARVLVPELELINLAGAFGDRQLGVRSRVVEGTHDLYARLSDLQYLGKLYETFAVDAWLANWDVVGLALDNIQTVQGNPMRLDAGGALLFRPKGGAKGGKFSDVVNEIDSLRNATRNPEAARVFKGVTDRHLRAGVKRVEAISEKRIDELVDRRNFPSEYSALLKEKLKARRNDLIARWGTPGTPALSGDGRVHCSCGKRHWGRFGAAGLLLFRRDEMGEVQVLMHQRAASDMSATWSLPGGARNGNEASTETALREATEETDLDAANVRVHTVLRNDHGGWFYDTVVASTEASESIRGRSRETGAVAWLRPAQVDELALHPGFAESWPALRAELEVIASRPGQGLMGVPERELHQVLHRLTDLKAGSKPVVLGVEAFGSRAGSLYRGGSPRPDSDLDLLVIVDDTLEAYDLRELYSLIAEIGGDGEFQARTGFPLNMEIARNPAWYHTEYENTPFVSLYSRIIQYPPNVGVLREITPSSTASDSVEIRQLLFGGLSVEETRDISLNRLSDEMTCSIAEIAHAAGRHRDLDHLGEADYYLVLQYKYSSQGYGILHRERIANPIQMATHIRMDDKRAEQIIRTRSIFEMLIEWEGAPDGPKKQAIQEVARREFQLYDVTNWSVNPDAQAAVDGQLSSRGPVLSDLLRAQYRITQSYLSEQGITELPLYRGFNWSREGRPSPPTWASAPAGSVVSAPIWDPLTSWTVSPRVATQYTHYEPADSAVVAAVVPADRILALGATGYGDLGDSEIVVLATSGQATIVQGVIGSGASFPSSPVDRLTGWRFNYGINPWAELTLTFASFEEIMTKTLMHETQGVELSPLAVQDLSSALGVEPESIDIHSPGWPSRLGELLAARRVDYSRAEGIELKGWTLGEILRSGSLTVFSSSTAQELDLLTNQLVPSGWLKQALSEDPVTHCREAWRQATNQLTAHQREAVAKYSRLGTAWVNDYLRGQTTARSDTIAMIDAIDSALSIRPTLERLNVYRGVTTESFDRAIEDLPGTVQREPGYLSTSVRPNTVAVIANPVVLKLEVPPGVPALYLETASHAPSDYELLLRRDLQYMVVRVEHVHGTWFVYGHILTSCTRGSPSGEGFQAGLLTPTPAHGSSSIDYATLAREAVTDQFTCRNSWEAVKRAAARISVRMEASTLAIAQAVQIESEKLSRIGDRDHWMVLFDTVHTSSGYQIMGSSEVKSQNIAPDRLLRMDNPRVEPIVRQNAVLKLIKAWHESANNHPLSLAVQEIAHLEFGQGDIMPYESLGYVRDEAQMILRKHPGVLYDFMRSQYGVTQDYLRDAGIDHLVLYRGFSWYLSRGGVPDWAGLPSGSVVSSPPARPLSSWSSDIARAQGYADGEFRRGNVAAVVGATVPASRIYALAQTGFGDFSELEFVVLATPGEVEIIESRRTGR